MLLLGTRRREGCSLQDVRGDEDDDAGDTHDGGSPGGGSGDG